MNATNSSFLEIVDNALNTLARRETSINNENRNVVSRNRVDRRNFTYRRNTSSNDLFSLLSNQFIDEYINSNPQPFNVLDDIITIYIDIVSGNNNSNTEDLSSITPTNKLIDRKPSQINKILGPYQKVTKNDILIEPSDGDKCCCTICLDEYKINQCKRILSCNHTFHKKCIDKWFNKNSECPVCRKNVFT
jgi:hypothetical protein|tara:strand:+ start:99 stop:671 length:573 start_codon:yes stop_codon:yes gene_type:complete